jgi:nitrate/TMAO reductase-like tetraheme cytochrome c subunit
MMRWVRYSILAFVIFVNLGFLAAAASGLLGFENPRAPIAQGDLPINANFTGKELPGSSYGRNLPGQLIHANFQKNSNSCASCHITHISGSAALQFQSSIYNSCVTCHDGSLGPYDVLNGSVASGVFYDTRLDVSGRSGVSYHLATGARTHGDAPGSRVTRRGVEVPGNWDQPFTCVSCHGPHSSYSERHLHYNPNGQAPRYENITLTKTSDNPERYGLQPDNQGLVPWLYYDLMYFPENALYVYTSGGLDITGQFLVNYATGVLERVSGSSIPAKVTFTSAAVVEMDITDHYLVSEQVTHRSGITAFCTSCHVAYYDQDQQDFAWHDNFYHMVGINAKGKLPDAALESISLERLDSNQYLMTCLTCHFAHGTDLSEMQRRGTNWQSSGELVPLENTYSLENTANLRYFNPGNGDGFDGRFEACYLCHNAFPYYPEVHNTSPIDDAYGVDANTSIDISFNLILDESTLTADMVTVNDGVSNITGTVTLRPDKKTVRFNGTLEPGKDYTVTVTGVESRIGGTLREPYVFTFHTYMAVESASPTGGDVPVSSVIEVWMTDAINEATVDEVTFWVSYDDGQALVDIAGTRSVSGKKITFTATGGLPPAEDVTVVLSADIRSNSGIPLQPYSWSFTTAP